MSNDFRRGGRGTNQYSVKPMSSSEEATHLREIHALKEVGAPRKLDAQDHENGVDERLNDILDRIESEDQEVAEQAQQELTANYPDLYVAALKADPEVMDEARDGFDADVDELTAMISDSNGEEDPVSEDSARLSALIVTVARDRDGRGDNLSEINQQVTQRNRSLINSLNF